jgi:hypothetical protein
VFRHALRGISGSEKDKDILMFLSAYLSSNLAKYFLFHTSANWGIERDKVHVEELLTLPFPLPEEALDLDEGQKIMQEVVNIVDQTKQAILANVWQRKDIVETAKQKILTQIYRYYDVDEFEQVLIEDTVNISIPSSTPTRNSKKIPTLEPTIFNDRKNYTDFLCSTLNEWIKKHHHSIIGSVIISEDIGIGIITLNKKIGISESVSYEEEKSGEVLNTLLLKLGKLFPEEERKITLARSLKVFDQNNLYICKPLSKRYWTKTAALNDADEIAFAIISQNYGKS